MKKTKTKKGITLVALIITIVVLLILAAVAIGAVKNSDIIGYARNAEDSYTIAQEKEDIGLAFSEWNIKKSISTPTETFKLFMEAALSDKATVRGEDNGPLTVTFHKTGNVYIVDENGNISKQEDDQDEDDDGEDDQIINDFEITIEKTPNGSPVSSVTLTIRPIIPESWKKTEFTEEEAVEIVVKEMFGEGTTISNLEQFVLALYNTFINMNETGNPFYGLEAADDLNDLADKLSSQLGKNNATEQEIMTYLLQTLGAPYTTVEQWAADVYEYKPTTYSVKIRSNGGDWKDITNTSSWSYTTYQVNINGNYEIQMKLDDKKSTEPVEVTGVSYLGKYVKYDANGDGSVEDETIMWRVLRNDAGKVELISADGLGRVDLTSTSFDVARTQYNEAVELIIAECKRVTGITENIRNAGGPEEDETTMNETVDFSELKNFSKRVSDDYFAQYEGTENGLKVGDEGDKYLEDWNQMQVSGTIAVDNFQEYWLASRFLDVMYTTVNFRMLYVTGGWSVDNNCLCSVDWDAASSYVKHEHSLAVRPVLTLEPGILEGVTQAGTKDEPIEIYQNN